MIFVEKALSMMNLRGYAAIIIQNSAGSGKAKELNKKILAKYTACKYQNAYRFICWKIKCSNKYLCIRVGESHQKMKSLSLSIFQMMVLHRAKQEKKQV